MRSRTRSTHDEKKGQLHKQQQERSRRWSSWFSTRRRRRSKRRIALKGVGGESEEARGQI